MKRSAHFTVFMSITVSLISATSVRTSLSSGSRSAREDIYYQLACDEQEAQSSVRARTAPLVETHTTEIASAS